MKDIRNLIQIWLLCAVMLQALTSGAQPVTQIAAGNSYSLFLKSDGSLWGMGYNYSGELGDGTYGTAASYYSTNRPELIVANNVTTIAAGGHSLFLKSNGSLWGMGDDAYGELGDGNYGDLWGCTNRPEQIVASNVTAIAVGVMHSLFIKVDGSLWGMGYNGSGDLGDGTYGIAPYYSTNRPEQIVARNVTAIAAGDAYSLFIKSDGSLWAMGDNINGQLGDGTTNSTNQPEQILASNVTAIAAGISHSLFLKSDGSLWAMGKNNHGQLGDGTYNQTNQPEMIASNNVTAIAVGTSHSLFLKSDGSLWGMGYNGDGDLGDGTLNDTNRPEQIVTSGVMAIAGGGIPEDHSLFLKSDGGLWGMGDDAYGELGDGTYGGLWGCTNQPEQILAAYNQISGQVLSGGKMQLSFVGIANANYALDRSASLSPTNWIPQVTNAAGSFGALVFTNTPDPTTNNFWRIRSVP